MATTGNNETNQAAEVAPTNETAAAAADAGNLAPKRVDNVFHRGLTALSILYAVAWSWMIIGTIGQTLNHSVMHWDHFWLVWAVIVCWISGIAAVFVAIRNRGRRRAALLFALCMLPPTLVITLASLYLDQSESRGVLVFLGVVVVGLAIHVGLWTGVLLAYLAPRSSTTRQILSRIGIAGSVLTLFGFLGVLLVLPDMWSRSPLRAIASLAIVLLNGAGYVMAAISDSEQRFWRLRSWILGVLSVSVVLSILLQLGGSPQQSFSQEVAVIVHRLGLALVVWFFLLVFALAEWLISWLLPAPPSVDTHQRVDSATTGTVISSGPSTAL